MPAMGHTRKEKKLFSSAKYLPEWSSIIGTTLFDLDEDSEDSIVSANFGTIDLTRWSLFFITIVMFMLKRKHSSLNSGSKKQAADHK